MALGLCGLGKQLDMHNTTLTKYINANGTRYAYRTLGKHGDIPLIFLQHFTGNMDDWDPLISDGLAETRPVVLFNNKGISSTSGTTPDSIAEMAADTIDFITALGYTKVDLLAYSIGGFIGQQVLIDRPDLIRKIILVGTAPKGGVGVDRFRAYIMDAVRREEPFLYLFFTPTDKSRNAGKESAKRMGERRDRDPRYTKETFLGQTKAIEDWGLMKSEDDYLGKIDHPTLIVNGSRDEMMLPENSYDMFWKMPNAQLSMYPDAAHGSLFQYPELFVEQASFFLNDTIDGSPEALPANPEFPELRS